MKKKNWIILSVSASIILVILIIIGVSIFMKANDYKDAEYAAMELLEKQYGTSPEADSFEKIEADQYEGVYSIETEGKLWSRSGTVRLKIDKGAGGWEAEVIEDNVEYTFADNKNYYEFAPRFAGNHSEIFQIIDMDKESITLKFYCHDLGNYGKDEFDSGIDTIDMTYNAEINCFEFERYGFWRVYSYEIQYLRYEIHSGPNDTYEKVEAVDPNDFWWFEEAKNGADDTITQPETQDETQTQTQPQSQEIPVTGNEISGNITEESGTFSYIYTPTNSGWHRFDLDIDNVNSNYEVEIITSKQQVIASCKYSSRDKGISINLTAGQKYTIKVSYVWQNCDYTITIGEPNPIKTISGTSFSGNLDYADKTDVYQYKAAKTGLYRFDLQIGDVNANYLFKIVNKKNASLVDTKYSMAKHNYVKCPGVNVNLTAGETYTIEVAQDIKFCDYTIAIGVPNDTVNVSGNVIKGAITFWGQENSYIYNAKKTGTYTFYLDISDLNSNYEVVIKDKKNATHASVTYSQAKYANKVANFEVPLDAGQYTITVYQDNNLCNYSIKIEEPKS